jgi:tRNA1(Val) A37 N6-methylase TrmN6
MTPEPLASRLVDQLSLTKDDRVLEPSFGSGNFLIPLIRRFVALHEGTAKERLHKVLTQNVFGVELDPEMYRTAISRIVDEFGVLPSDANLVNADFFRVEYFDGFFDLVVGNPPFGGTFDPDIEDLLDRRFGRWNGHKLKKETYSFFIAKSLEVLATDGELVFITSDTFLTIRTMSGLRQKLMDLCAVKVEILPSFSDETTQPTLVLRASRTGRAESVEIDGTTIARSAIELTGNFSWRIDTEWERYFKGPTLGEYVVASSGMTVGKNELFVREIVDGNKVYEPYRFDFFDDPITVARELERARLNKLSQKTLSKFAEMESSGDTRRNLRVVDLPNGPEEILLPHSDYRFYNKSQSGIVYQPPSHAIFWKDDGDAVLTFKKNGNWYLHGVGGRPFFGREGITWQLVSSRLNMRYLPSGFILDRGAPCAFLRDGVAEEELYFILAWTLTDLASAILKSVINHTRNIQSKDVERLPYPFWVTPKDKKKAIALMKSLVENAVAGKTYTRSSEDVKKLDGIFAWQ